MTALTAARKTRAKLNRGDRYRDIVVATGETIYPGAIVGLDAAGLAEAGSSASTIVAGRSISSETKEAGDTVRVAEGEAPWAQSGATTITAAHIGDACRIVDDQTVTVDGTNPFAGVITNVDDEGVWVDMGVTLGGTLVLVDTKT